MDPLISDLALILICAGVMTLIFKRLKQPLVLGYIVAGFIASPHFGWIPSVINTDTIRVWSDIGVIFLLFALGLEFSFKKIARIGGTAVMAAVSIIFCMIMVGIFVGWCFGWQQMDCIYLGGMLAMSSTTIIYKAYDDMGLRQQHFAGLVLGILIIEDVLAIVLMVMLSTIAVSQKFEGAEMALSILKLVFFLTLWIVAGVFLIPSFLKRVKRFMGAETLLIVSLALCFGMVVCAHAVDFSPAFGAFIMGSVLAETNEVENIHRLVEPVKNLFGAIFFVSVGMMVDPQMIVQYIVPIVSITLAILLGQTIFGSTSILLSGQPLKVAMRCGFSLTQIGEFAFIIASLGVSLGVTSDFLYPVVVAVSVFTTFLTPYMIRLAVPAYEAVNKCLPHSWQNILNHYTSSVQPINNDNLWKKYILSSVKVLGVYAVVCYAILLIFVYFVYPIIEAFLPQTWAKLLEMVLTLLCLAPFVRALVARKYGKEFHQLWADKRTNHAPLVCMSLFRITFASLVVSYVFIEIYKSSIVFAFMLSLPIVLFILISRRLKRQSIAIEKRFIANWNGTDNNPVEREEPEYATSLLPHDIHLSIVEIPVNSAWAGKTLKELNVGTEYGVHIASILRGPHRINIPGGADFILPNDSLQVIGSDEQLMRFAGDVSGKLMEDDEHEEMKLKHLVIDEGSPLVGMTIRNSAFRDEFQCLVVGVEREAGILQHPHPDMPFKVGDIVWLVGEEHHILRMTAKNH
ncbi:MAG: cation:proton antiporter [Bacteroidales bacterium]|nr:cation:proton antiporter [Bacteroidales bacterium]